MRPTSQTNIFVTGSNVYFPCEGFKMQFKTDFGIGISSTTFSTLKMNRKVGNLLVRDNVTRGEGLREEEVEIFALAKISKCNKHDTASTAC